MISGRLRRSIYPHNRKRKKLWGEVGGFPLRPDGTVWSSPVKTQSGKQHGQLSQKIVGYNLGHMANPVPQEPNHRWSITESVGAAGPFHEKRPTEDTGPQVWIHRPVVPTLVLGSSQPSGVVNDEEANRRGVDVCRRRSGGGLVYIAPDTDCWIDLIIPSTSKLFDVDIAKAFHWVGAHWAKTLQTYSAPFRPLEIVMATENQQSGASDLLCFAGIGHGELMVDGRKVVGLSQRRSRSWARIQSIVIGRWNPAALEPLIRTEALGNAGLRGLDSVSAGLPDDLPPPDPSALARLFTASLPEC